MYSLTQLKQATSLFLIVLVCLGLLPEAQAVVPSPDGGYPGGNTAEGQNALFSLTTGGFNTAVGFLSLRSNATNAFNTAVGAGALLVNTADENTATGAGALLSNATGGFNTAYGAFALSNNTSGSFNTAIGHLALSSNTVGDSNMAIGESALLVNTTGGGNVAIGTSALRNNNASENVVIGHSAGLNMTAGSHCVLIGPSTGNNITSAFNVICIGASAAAANVSGTCFIGNIYGTTTQNNDAVPVLIDSAGQLGTASSSRRYKTDIKPMDNASESVLALKPVSFRYKVHTDSKPQFGLIAEEVAEVNPNLVIYDHDGKPYTVRYEAVNAMLLNEFLKEHKTVQDLKTTVAEQKKQIDALTAGLQKVSARLEASKPAPQVVNNP